MVPPAGLRHVAPLALAVLAVAAAAQQPPGPKGTATDAEQAQQDGSRPRFELGLNALQGGVFEGGNWRGRVYDAVEVLLGAVRLGHYGLNEAGPDYRFGQNTVSLGLADTPGVALIVAAKHDNAGDYDLALAQSGIGLRVDDRLAPLPWGLYYNLQLFKNTGSGSTSNSELEGILLIGRTIAGNDLTLYLDWQRHADPYFEVEAVSPSVAETAGLQLRLWARVEGTDADDARLGAGLHLPGR